MMRRHDAGLAAAELALAVEAAVLETGQWKQSQLYRAWSEIFPCSAC